MCESTEYLYQLLIYFHLGTLLGALLLLLSKQWRDQFIEYSVLITLCPIYLGR
jgi:hypothetical protein